MRVREEQKVKYDKEATVKGIMVFQHQDPKILRGPSENRPN